MNIDDFVKLAEPFDLVAFARKDVVSKVINVVQSVSIGHETNVSHVGVVVVLGDEKYLWESYYTDKYFGVQTRPLREVLAAETAAGNKVGLCKLTPAAAERITPAAAEECFETLNHRIFNISPLDLIAAAFPILRPLREKINRKLSTYATPGWMFSSEFVAACYIKLGVINDLSDGVADGKILNPKDFIPSDFLGGDVDGLIPFTRPPIWI